MFKKILYLLFSRISSIRQNYWPVISIRYNLSFFCYLVKSEQVSSVHVSDVDPDPYQWCGSGSVSMMRIRIRVAKNLLKSWETRIRIDRNHHNIIFLNIEFTLLFNAHIRLANTMHDKSFLLSLIILMGKKVLRNLVFSDPYQEPGSASSWCGSTSLVHMYSSVHPVTFFGNIMWGFSASRPSP